MSDIIGIRLKLDVKFNVHSLGGKSKLYRKGDKLIISKKETEDTRYIYLEDDDHNLLLFGKGLLNADDYYNIINYEYLYDDSYYTIENLQTLLNKI